MRSEVVDGPCLHVYTHGRRRYYLAHIAVPHSIQYVSLVACSIYHFKRDQASTYLSIVHDHT